MEPTGIVSGGWPYVIAAYSISWVVILAYISSLFIRERQ